MHFLVLQHVDVEHPGIFRDFWRAEGISWTTVELDEGDPIPEDLTRFDAMVVMGGPMDVWQTTEHPWLVPEVASIRRFVVELGRPFLGICLGHQLLAVALGGTVGPARAPEVGPCLVRLTGDGANDPLLAGLSVPLLTFQWHGAEVGHLPQDGVRLAETDLCRVQALRWGPHAYGLQFHAELTTETVDDWRRIPAYARSLEEALGPGASERLAAETLERLPSFNRTAARLNQNFLGLVRAWRAAGA